MTITSPKLTKWAKDLGMRLHLRIHTARTYTHAGTAPQTSRTVYNLSLEATKYDMQLQCFQLATFHTAAAEGNMSMSSEGPRTPFILDGLDCDVAIPVGPCDVSVWH